MTGFLSAIILALYPKEIAYAAQHNQKDFL
jgi:hypothetical protein